MSSSKSSSQSKQSAVTTDNKIVADNGSLAASGGSSITRVSGDNGAVVASGGSTINFLSKDVAMGALETATELGKASLAQSGEFAAGVLELADRQASATEAARVGNNNLAQNLAETAISRVQQSAQSDPVQVVNTLAKYGAWAVGGIVAVVVLIFVFNSKGKKS